MSELMIIKLLSFFAIVLKIAKRITFIVCLFFYRFVERKSFYEKIWPFSKEFGPVYPSRGTRSRNLTTVTPPGLLFFLHYLPNKTLYQIFRNEQPLLLSLRSQRKLESDVIAHAYRASADSHPPCVVDSHYIQP